MNKRSPMRQLAATGGSGRQLAAARTAMSAVGRSLTWSVWLRRPQEVPGRLFARVKQPAEISVFIF
jgi:hypothetical protein